MRRDLEPVVGRIPPVGGNDVRLLTDTNEAQGLIEQAIASAESSINLEYYIWQRDRTGTRLRDLVVSKAREGVKVRFLFDGIGSLFLNNRFMRPMRADAESPSTATAARGRSASRRIPARSASSMSWFT